MAALNRGSEPETSEGPGQAPWGGRAGAAAERSARSLLSLPAATISAFRRGTRWVTGSLADARGYLTSQRGEARNFGNCPLPGLKAEKPVPSCSRKSRRGKTGKEKKARNL